MKKSVIAAVAVLMLASCGEKKFQVEGQIDGAKDSVLYFENIGLEGVVAVDSVKLSADGTFSFAAAATEAPEFYRLRIADEIINVSIDSTETVGVKAHYPGMAANYEVSGSDNCAKIKELALKQMELQQRAMAIQRAEQLSIDEANDSIMAVIKQYKDDVKMNYIFKAPDKAYSYFALFQTLGNMLLFNPRSDRSDIKAFAAVATSWDTFYPNAERGANLHNIAIEGMKNQRISDARENRVIEADKVSTTGLIDLALEDRRGQMRRLTDLKGKVVLLDFHMFSLDESPARILSLRELYNKYHSQGLEIYQVSLDGNEHFWKQKSAQLPWICVHDADGIASPRLQFYNIASVPEYFLIDRGNNLVGRSQQINNIDEAIRKLL